MPKLDLTRATRIKGPGGEIMALKGPGFSWESSFAQITGTAPVLGALADGDTLSDAVTWGSYSSNAGTISTPTTKEMSVNGAAFVAYNGATVVDATDTYQLRETVTDSAGTTPVAFTSGTVTVSGIAPTLAASDSLSGRTLTITVDTNDGVPTPSTALTALTLDGVDVLGDETGTGPWEYVVPDSAASQTVAWTVTATNNEGSDTASGSEAVAANLSAPSISGVPTIAGTETVGETLTATAASVTGTPTPTRTWQWERSGVAISGATSATYTLVAADEGETLTVVQTETNNEGTDTAESTATGTIAAADVTAPTATSITLGTQQSDGDVPITITDLDENSTAAWVLTSSDQSGAANTAVKAAAEGGTALTDQVDFGTFSATTGGGPYDESLTAGLDGNYYLQIVFFDAAGNISPVYADGPSAIDTTAMTLSGASTTAGDTTIDVDWSTNEGQGPARIVAVPNGATAPTVTENLAGQESGGTAADADSGNITVSASGAQTTVTLTGLTNGTAYDVYIAHDDGFGNTDQISVLNTTPAAASSNLVADGGFDDPSKWFFSSGMDVTDSAIEMNGTNAAFVSVNSESGSYTSLPSDASTYELSFDVTRLGVSGDRLRISPACYNGAFSSDTNLGSTTPDRIPTSTITINATGTYGPYTFTVQTGATHLKMVIQAIDANMDMSIDNLVITEV